MSSRERDVADAFSALAPTYDDHYSRPCDLADNDVIFYRARELYALTPPGLFIDLGCGPGTALDWNVAGPDEYLGIDVADGMIEEAMQRHPGYSFQVGDHTALPIGGASFVLGGFGPLQYVHPLKVGEVAQAVLGALKPGGRFLLMARPRATPTRALGDDLTCGWRADDLADHFDVEGAEIAVYGHRGAVSRKFSRMSRKLQTMSLLAERLFPLRADAAEWIVVEGHVITC